MTGSSTVTIASGVATFSIPQTGNIGVGDRVTYNSTSVAYISGRTSTSVWTLETATGSIPANISGAIVSSIGHEYNSLNAAIGGGGSVYDSNHLNNKDLTALNVVLDVPCYYDNGPDTTYVYGSTATTSATNYINIYTATSSSQVNRSQRHNGKWTNNAYQLDVSTSSAIALTAGIDFVRIDGLQVQITTSSTTAAIGLNFQGKSITDITDFQISNNIIAGVFTGPANNGAGIYPGFWGSASNNVAHIWNNLVYGFANAANTGLYGIRNTGFILYAYNNTFYNDYRGIFGSSGATTTAKNNIVQASGGVGFDYGGTFLSSSTNNISNSTGAPGTNAENSTTTLFVSTSTNDFHLSANDTTAKDIGTNLSSDPAIAFNTDINGYGRPYGSSWDIGAEEFTQFTLSYAAGSNGTLTGSTTQVVTAQTNGTSVTAVPNSNYYFLNWSDGSTTNPRTDTNVQGNVNVTANFISAPGVPTNVTAYAGNTVASVYFNAPSSNGGSPITSYTITSSPGNLSTTTTATTSPYVFITGLTNTTSYTFSVTASNSVGTSASSTPSSSITPTSAGETYYVDSSGGSDANNGISSGTAWQTIARINSAVLEPGDHVLFKKGDIWREQLTVPASGASGNPITFDAYSTGSNPVISGSDLVTGWSTTYPTLNFQVGTTTDNSWDDSYLADYWTNNNPRYDLYLSRSDEGKISAGFRFTNVAIPQGTTILNAGFSAYADPSASVNAPNITTTLYGEATNTAASFSYTNPMPSARTKTNSSNSYLSTTTGWASKNVTSIVQEIINRAGWVSGNALSILTYSGLTASTLSLVDGYDRQYPALLSITYSGSTLPNIYNSPVAFTPQQVFRNGIRMIPETTVSALTSDDEWFYDPALQLLYVYSTSNPTGYTIEASNRNFAILDTDKSNLTFNNLTLQETNSISSSTNPVFAFSAGLDVNATTTSISNISLTNVSADQNYQSGVHFETHNTRTINGIILNSLEASYNGVLRSSNHEYAALYFDGTSGGAISNVTITNGNLANNGLYGTTSVAVDNQYGVNFNNVATGTITNLTSDNNGLAGVNVENGSTNLYFSGGSFYDNGLILGADAAADGEGIGIGSDNNASTNITLNGVNVYGNYAGQIAVSFTTTNQIPMGILIENSMIHDSMPGSTVAAGIGIGGGLVSTYAPSVTVINNLIYNNYLDGILVGDTLTSSSSNEVIQNNDIWNNGKWGITLDVGTTTIADNIIADSGTNTPADPYEIRVDPIVPFFEDYDFVSHPVGGYPKYLDYGLNEQTASSWYTATGQGLHSTIGNGLDPEMINDGVNFNLQPLSPLVDAGTTTSARTTDMFGNPLYGNSSIGAIEYQPPYTSGISLVDPTGNIRIYADGKFRYTTATSSTMSANLSAAPVGGFPTLATTTIRADWLDISNITWGTSKTWTASSSIATSTVFTVGNLTPNNAYSVYFTHGGPKTLLGTQTTNGSGLLLFTYTNGYSTATFEVDPIASSTVTTSSATGVTTSAATLNATITATGGSDATQSGFAYSTDPTLTSGVSTSTLGAQTGTASFSQNLSSLNSNITYYFRAYVINPAGTSYGSIQSFTTLTAIPTVTSSSASSITASSVLLGGVIAATGGANATQSGFAYGTDPTLTSSVSTTTLGSQSGAVPFSQTESSLSPNVTYYFRAYATNAAGTGFGVIQTFITSTALPTLMTGATLPVSTSTATLNATITSTGGSDATQSGFAYSTDPTLTSGVSTSTLGAQTGTASFSQPLIGLTSNTTYYLRPYAVNTSGTGFGTIQPFSTIAIVPPALIVNAASAISMTSATLNGTMTADGGITSSVEGFNYGITSAYGSVASSTGVFDVGTFSQTITGLTCGTAYQVQSFATNLSGVGTSTDSATFSTSACPVTPASVAISFSSGGGSVSTAELTNLLAPSASTTAYLNSLNVASVPGCPSRFICTPSISATTPTTLNPVSTTTVFTFTRNLKVGMTGVDVKQLQIFLNFQGFTIAKSGAGSLGHETTLFGSLTKAALAKFQKANGIAPSVGYFGPMTRAFIQKL